MKALRDQTGVCHFEVWPDRASNGFYTTACEVEGQDRIVNMRFDRQHVLTYANVRVVTCLACMRYGPPEAP